MARPPDDRDRRRADRRLPDRRGSGGYRRCAGTGAGGPDRLSVRADPGDHGDGSQRTQCVRAEEIDVAFWNEGDPSGLRQFDHIVLVECKNWSVPVGYPELAVFLQKLESRGRPLGIFVAAAGITGDPADLTRAHSVLSQALQQRREIIVVTRHEIEQLTDTGQLVRLLKQKRAQLAVSGTIYRVDRKSSPPTVAHG